MYVDFSLNNLIKKQEKHRETTKAQDKDNKHQLQCTTKTTWAIPAITPIAQRINKAHNKDT